MTITWLDIALPLGLATIFAFVRYKTHARSGSPSPQTRATLDGLNGAIGLTVITFAYKYFTSN